MSVPDRLEVVSASSEFIALCHSQMVLLTHGLGASWSAVYLTEGFADNLSANLIPVAVYPETDGLGQENSPLPILPPEVGKRLDSEIRSQPSLPSKELSEQLESSLSRKDRSLGRRAQVVLPLIYEDMVVGLLVTRREDREWTPKECDRLKKVASTIAIACLLDRRQNWYRQQSDRQQNLRRIEKERLDDFLHQLRNPVTALRTFSKLLLKRFLPGDRNQSVAQSMLRESDRIADLVQQFEGELQMQQAQPSEIILVDAASVSLPDTNESSFLPAPELHLEALTIRAILEPLVGSATAIASDRGIELSADIPADLPPIKANSSALREVLSNIIDNALKYTPTRGKVNIKAGLEDRSTTGRWQGIAVSDTGYGIPPADRERIFERHYRGVQSNGNIPGTGLGLAIAKELTERMHGKIELISFQEPESIDSNSFRSERLAGTTFIVWLPLAD